MPNYFGQTIISVNFSVIFIVLYVILFCSAPLSSIVSGAIQIHFVIVIVILLNTDYGNISYRRQLI